jgi:hypothetical protein
MNLKKKYSFILLDYFDVLMSKIIFKKQKQILF